MHVSLSFAFILTPKNDTFGYSYGTEAVLKLQFYAAQQTFTF